MSKKDDFFRITADLMARAHHEVERWEERVSALEADESPKAEALLETATRRLETWESIVEGLEEIKELLEELQES